ncbi:unnamed protein product [Kluyveromyces dobzhanskii CBS 2104]|uniref:WGS project CCBQ000000000 data, contig 00102 n=1 Tax=Kluyveromyces dobzhanskii CBS 2104 TaxID=1427455 RepID=A0A0A8L425_9SACH|nr:unnamed protein product [Kluyveromyces dobzhanskii CBS 2104]
MLGGSSSLDVKERTVDNAHSFCNESMEDVLLHTIFPPEAKTLLVPNELDEAMEFATHHEHIELTPKEDSRVRRKLDLIVMPLFSFLYMIQFMDKTCISFAAVMGIQEDYNMAGTMYSWTTSCFYLGYLIASPLAAVTLQKLPSMRTTAVFIIIWGVVQCLHATAKSYSTFTLLRTLLGVLEAFVSPIFVIMMNQYYKKSEHFGYIGVLYGFNGLGTVLLACISYGLYINLELYTMKAYKVLFIIVGCLTILNGLLILFIMPNTPADAKFLTEREKLVVLERIRGNNQGFGSKKFKWHQVKECVCDIRTWLYFFIGTSVAIPNGAISSFGSIILLGLGYSTEKSLLMKAPVGATEMVGLVILPLMSYFIPKRTFVAVAYLLICVLGSCLLAFGPIDSIALAGYYITGIAPVGIIAVTSLVVSNTAGHTKKLTANAISLIGYSAGNIIGPQTFRSSDGPGYHKAKAAIVGCYGAAIVLMIFMSLINVRQNRKRDNRKRELGDKYVVLENQAFADLTDFENSEFRYSI